MIRGKKILGALLAFTLCFSMVIPAQADDISDAKKKQQELEQQKNTAEAEKSELSSELDSIVSKMEKTQSDLTAKETEINDAETELVTAKANEDDQYQTMKLRIKYMYENGSNEFLEILMEANSIADLLNKAEYINKISKCDRELLVEYEDTRKDVENRENALKKEYAELESLQDELAGEQANVEKLLAATVIEGSKDGYPELEEKKDFIMNVIRKEEEQFEKTIDQGLVILNEMKEKMAEEGTKTLSGEDAFKLYDTYGFPIDLTKEILEEEGIDIDEEGFKAAMEVQRQTARKARKATNYMGADATVYESIDPSVTSKFVGYEHLEYESKITVLTTEDEIVDALSDGERGTIFVDETPFYATSGGQEADHGVIKCGDGEFVVEDVKKMLGGKIGHIGYMAKGMMKVGDQVTLTVDPQRRVLCARNHSATHLLQKALRTVLGTHVEQSGSYVDDKRLRFDFSHFSAMTPEELQKVEDMVNESISRSLPVVIKNMPIEEARKTGAQALFGEKYGDIVRVVNMGDYSIEFCGGTHVANTSEIGAFKILSESGVAAGVRRIEALTSKGLMDYYGELEQLLHEAAKLLKATPDTVSEKIAHLQAENKELHSEVESLKSKAAKEALGDVMDQVEEAAGVKVIAVSVEDMDMNGLRDLGDQLKEKIGEGVVVIASSANGKVSLMATATDEAMKKGAHAGNLIKAIASCVGGGGGGRPNMAQAGGKNPAGIPDALAKVKEVLAEQIK